MLLSVSAFVGRTQLFHPFILALRLSGISGSFLESTSPVLATFIYAETSILIMNHGTIRQMVLVPRFFLRHCVLEARRPD